MSKVSTSRFSDIWDLGSIITLYISTPMQIYCDFYDRKNDKFQMKTYEIFLISAPTRDCESALEQLYLGCSNMHI